MVSILKNAVLLFALDVPWLYAVSGWSSSVVRGIQGTPLEFKLWPAIPVYLALGYLLQIAKSVQMAFLMGAATYIVYDFTNLATLKKYPVEFAIADSLWGGTLFAFAFWLKGVLRLE